MERPADSAPASTSRTSSLNLAPRQPGGRSAGIDQCAHAGREIPNGVKPFLLNPFIRCAVERLDNLPGLFTVGRLIVAAANQRTDERSRQGASAGRQYAFECDQMGQLR